MANVTFGTPTAYRHVIGDLVMRIFVVNGASGSTLNTNMSNLIWVENGPFNQAGTASVVTGITFNAATGVVTLTSSGTMVNEFIQVLSTKG